MKRITKEEHDIIQQSIYQTGRRLLSVRETIAYAAPEMQDFHWQQVADLLPELVTDVLTTLGYDEAEWGEAFK